MAEMTAAEMAKKYSIVLMGENLRIRNAPKNTVEVEAIRASKPEIVSYLRGVDEAEAKRQARVDSIKGLTELREYTRAMDAWEMKVEDAISSGMLRGMGEKPVRLEGDYPEADAYLALEAMSYASNDAKSSAGARGVEAVKDGESPIIALENAKAEWGTYCSKNIWN